MSFDYRLRRGPFDPPPGPDAEVSGVTILLTGTETLSGNFFRGDEDPADTPAYLAILQIGDKWTDTSPGGENAAFVRKEWNGSAWVLESIILRDPLTGDPLAEIRVDPDGGIVLDQGEGDVLITITEAGRIHMERGVASFSIEAVDDSIQLTSGSGTIRVEADGTITLDSGPASIVLTAAGDVDIGGATFFVTNASAPEVPASPTEQDIVNALMALGFVTQGV